MYVATCVVVEADDFRSAAPRRRLYFLAIKAARCVLTNQALREQLQEILTAIRLGTGNVKQCIATDARVISDWLQRRQPQPSRHSDHVDDEKSQPRWHADHAAVFAAAGLAWPPNPTPQQVSDSCWGWLNPTNLGTLTPREQDMIKYFSLLHSPKDFEVEDSSGTSPVWAYDLYHNLSRVAKRSPRGKRCKRLLTVLPHSDMFLVMAHSSRLAIPEELFAFQGFFLSDYGLSVLPAFQRARGPSTPKVFHMSYRDGADLMGNAFNLNAISAFLFAAAFHFGLSVVAPDQVPSARCNARVANAVSVVRSASGRVAGRIVSGEARCVLHPNCSPPSQRRLTGGSPQPTDEETLVKWLLTGSSFTTRLAHQAAFIEQQAGPR